MIRQCKTISLFAAFLWLVSSTNSLAFAQEKKTFVAYSMRVAQARVEQAIKQGIDWRKKEPDLFYLGGVTKPLAVVLDAKTNDWILVGERDPKSSVLTLDDWVVALRARFIHGERDPGVTIDPVCPEGEKIKGSCRNFTRQEVRFFGGIEDTNFGQVCYEADWLMKKISFALEKLPIEKLKTYYKLWFEQAQAKGGGDITRVMSRFWFYPIVNRVNVIGDVVLLEKFQMGVFTEVLYAEVNGKPVADVDKFKDYPSEGFSQSFSENHSALAEAREVLETLRGLTRLVALAKGLTQVDQKPNVDFYLKSYPMEKVKTPKEKEVLRVENREVGFEISGGVELMALAMRLKGGDASALKGLVVRARPSEEVLSWGFEMEVRDGQVTGVRLPDGVSDPNQIASLFAQAAFLQKKKRYDAAIEGYGKVLEVDRNVAEAYNNRGNVYADKGDYDKALADFSQAIAMNPNLSEAYNNRGITYVQGKRDYDRAIADLNQAIALNSNFAEAYNNRGAAHSQGKRQYDLAITDYDRAIALNPNLAEAYNNRGIAFIGKLNYDFAIADFNRAVALTGRLVGTIAEQSPIVKLESGFRATFLGIQLTLAENPTAEFLWPIESLDKAVKLGLATLDAKGEVTFNDWKGWKVEITCKKAEGEKLKQWVMDRKPLANGVKLDSYEVLSVTKRERISELEKSDTHSSTRPRVVGDAAARSLRLKAGYPTSLVEFVVSSRPASSSLSWTFDVPLNGSESKTFVAYSLKVAEAKTQEAERRQADFRQSMPEPEVWHLGGITKPWSFVFDSRFGDVILVGERGSKGVLTLDDLVVALRARFIHTYQNPGVAFLTPTGPTRPKMTEVRFFGGVENTHFGQACFDAHRLMERMALGLEPSRISGFKSYADGVAESVYERPGSLPTVRARFWFSPIVNQLNVFGDVVLLEKLQMGLLSEVMRAETDDKPVWDIGQFEYPPAENFSRTMSEKYAELAETYEELAILESLVRLAGLTKGLAQAEVRYWLERYQPAVVNTPRKVPVLRAERKIAGRRIEIRLW